MIEIQRILCPVDFSDCSRRAVDHAMAIARWYDASVTALHVYPLPACRGRADRADHHGADAAHGRGP